jgi:glycosyltransferase involved in cell wall biosynthesis
MPISAIIITYNEARNIARCINALKGVADEIIVVDSYSKDNTVAIAQELGAMVFQHPFEGYGEQKIVALKETQYDWILSLDADEELSPVLRQSILAIKDAPEHDAYSFNFLTDYCGHWVRHSGWYPNPKMRLWNKQRGHMTADKVHEGWELDAGTTTGFLKGDILHHSFPTISSHLKKIEQYSEIGARFDVQRGKKVSLLKLWFAPKWTFLSIYLFRGGFLDGYYGYVIAKNSAFAAFAKYLKIRQYTSMKTRGQAY